MATLDEVAETLAVAAAVYPNFKIQVGPQAFAAAWHRHVGHLSAPQFQAAFDRAVHGSEFFPTVHDVLKAHAQLEAGDKPTALESWGEVKAAMLKHGNYHGPKGTPYVLMENNYEWDFANPLTARAVAAIGWQELFEGTEDTLRAHYLRAYDTLELRQLSKAMELGTGPVRIAKLLEKAREGQP